MLLTLNPSFQNGIKGPHEYSALRQPTPTQRSPSPSASELRASAAPSKPSVDHSMDSSRSGLPPPSSLTLPPPGVGFAAMTTISQQLPPPPAQWQSSDDAMRHWLQAKAEEDRRKQEEEKTRQESLRLEQRKVEQSMLRDSLQAGVPPHMVPLIFAGISQGGLPPPILELTQQYLAQHPGVREPAPQSTPPTHSQRRPPHGRQDSRSVPRSPYAPPPAQQVVPPHSILLSQSSPSNVGAPHTSQSVGRSISNGPLDSRTGTNCRNNPVATAQIQSVPINLSNVQYAPGSSVPIPHVSRKSDFQSRQSPQSLYFHHWVPPGQPHSNAISGKAHQESSVSSGPSSRPGDQTSPGRKRKASGPHQQVPIPSSRMTSQPSCQQIDGQQLGEISVQRHQPSDKSCRPEKHPGDDAEPEYRRRTSSLQGASGTLHPSGDASNPEKSRHLTDDSQRGVDTSTLEDTDQKLPRVLQASYPSSEETGPGTSDLESASQRSPTSGTLPTSISTHPGNTSGK